MYTPPLLDPDSSKFRDVSHELVSNILGNCSSLQVLCEFNLGTGRLKRKIESSGYGAWRRDDNYTYSYDSKGHLTEVTHNHLPMEKYEYNEWGQRWCRQSGYNGECDYYVYEKDDSLRAAGHDIFEYDRWGNTISRKRGNGCVMYSYQRGVLLERVSLSDGSIINFVYGKGIPPFERYINGKLAAEYNWSPGPGGVYLLSLCRDHTQGLEFQFNYGSCHWPETMQIRKLSRLANGVWQKISKGSGDNVKLLCGCDQVGSLKRLADASGNTVKYINFDSFGNVIQDAFPELRLPLGFASGLWDHDSGLVRFGCRDYDPHIGRFLCPDPLGETGGDHDLYDYCVDDPVNCHDPNGLWTRATFEEQSKLG